MPMRDNAKARLPILALAAVLSILRSGLAAPTGTEPQPLSTKQVQALLLKDRDFRNDTELIALGEKALPGLVETLNASENQIECERALWVLARLKVEKQKVVPHIVPLLNRKAKWLKIYALQALAAVDATEASKDILALLNDDDEAIRVNALRTLGAVGERSDAQEIQNALKKRREKSNQADVNNDHTFKEGDKAIAEIEKRENNRKNTVPQGTE